MNSKFVRSLQQILTQDLVLVGDYAHLVAVALHSLQRESFFLSLLNFKIETDHITHSFHSMCTPCTHSTEEKNLKLILTFTVSSIHNEIHSFMKTQLQRMLWVGSPFYGLELRVLSCMQKLPKVSYFLPTSQS
jgi:hypothetical protein